MKYFKFCKTCVHDPTDQSIDSYCLDCDDSGSEYKMHYNTKMEKKVDISKTALKNISSHCEWNANTMADIAIKALKTIEELEK